jgi:hypothetical protein
MRRLWRRTPERTFVGLDKSVFKLNEALKTQFGNSPDYCYADIINEFCDENGCLTRIGEDKRAGITSFDSTHLTPVASHYLAKKLLCNMVMNDSPNNSATALVQPNNP